MEIVTDKPVTGKITVTRLEYDEWEFSTGIFKEYFAESYANIEKGKTMILKSNGPDEAQAGSFKVTVTDVDFLDYGGLSTRFGSLASRIWNEATKILELQSIVYFDDTKYIVTVSDRNSVKHKVLNDVKPNDSIVFSFHDMDPFDWTVGFTFPPASSVNLQLSGSERNPQFTRNYHYLFNGSGLNTPTSIDVPYLDILTNYRTYLTISYSDLDFSYQYRNIGSIPEGQATWPHPSDFKIKKSDFTNFSATSFQPYVWRESIWTDVVSGEYSVRWSVSSSSGTQSIKELPTEITDLHPVLSLEKLDYRNTTFYTQSPAFGAYIKSVFETRTDPEGVRLGIRVGATN